MKAGGCGGRRCIICRLLGRAPVDKRSIVLAADQAARPWHKCHRSPLALQLTSFENSACACCRYPDRVMEGTGGGIHFL